MARNIEQVNEFFLRELGVLIAKELPLKDGFVSISYVNCSPDLLTAKVGVLVLPYSQKSYVLKGLKKLSSNFSQLLRKKSRLCRIPRLNWMIDEYESFIQ